MASQRAMAATTPATVTSTSNLEHGSCYSHSRKPSDSGLSDNCKFVYGPGRSYLDVKDDSRRDDGKSNSTSISTSSETCVADTHHKTSQISQRMTRVIASDSDSA
jgi:hypothetical protein